jgi:hypothetical protein
MFPKENPQILNNNNKKKKNPQEKKIKNSRSGRPKWDARAHHHHPAQPQKPTQWSIIWACTSPL